MHPFASAKVNLPSRFVSHFAKRSAISLLRDASSAYVLIGKEVNAQATSIKVGLVRCIGIYFPVGLGFAELSIATLTTVLAIAINESTDPPAVLKDSP